MADLETGDVARPGLLATFSFGATLLRELPDLSDAIEEPEIRNDKRVLGALYRDYSFLASAYLLEPCHERRMSGEEGYGLGRQRLPAVLAKPLAKVAAL